MLEKIDFHLYDVDTGNIFINFSVSLIMKDHGFELKFAENSLMTFTLHMLWFFKRYTQPTDEELKNCSDRTYGYCNE